MPHGDAVGLFVAAQGAVVLEIPRVSRIYPPPLFAAKSPRRFATSKNAKTMYRGRGGKTGHSRRAAKPHYLRCAAPTNRIAVRHSAAAPWDDEFRAARPRLVNLSKLGRFQYELFLVS